MEIPEPGKEGYIIRVTEENHKRLSEICGWELDLEHTLNYDPDMGSSRSSRYFSYSESDEDEAYISTDSTEITVEQLQQILFIESLEN